MVPTKTKGVTLKTSMKITKIVEHDKLNLLLSFAFQKDERQKFYIYDELNKIRRSDSAVKASLIETKNDRKIIMVETVEEMNREDDIVAKGKEKSRPIS